MEFDPFIIHVKTSLLTTGTSESYTSEVAFSKDVKQTCQKNEGSLAAQDWGKFLKEGKFAVPPWD